MAFEDSINCSWIEERVDPFLDGDLPGGELTRFQKHIADCRSCRNEVAMAGAMLAQLRALPLHECPEGVVDRAEAVLEASSNSWWQRLKEWSDAWTSVLMRPAMATMVVIVVAAGVFVLTLREDRNPSDAEIREASREVQMAFAYVGKYTTRATDLLREDVMNERVVPAVEKAMWESGNAAIINGLMPAMKKSMKNVTNEEEERSGQ